MEKIKAILKRIFATDKVAHFGVCFILAVAVATLLRRYDCAIFVGALAAIAAGIGKEAWDNAHGGKFDTWDILADFLGTFAGAVCSILLLQV